MSIRERQKSNQEYSGGSDSGFDILSLNADVGWFRFNGWSN